MNRRQIITIAEKTALTKWLLEKVRFAYGIWRVFQKFEIRWHEYPTTFFKLKRMLNQCDWNTDEFFYYHYPNLTKEQVKAFISEKEHDKIADMLNGNNNIAVQILGDKWNTYIHFKPFFKRQACLSSEWIGSQLEQSDANRLILKPLRGSFGSGIIILKTSEIKGFLEREKNCEYIIEEVVEQDERMAKLHPQSVNTLRIHTICFEDKVEVFHPYLRVGRGNSIVDNAGNGGVFTCCDKETGKVMKIVDEAGHSFKEHPDNGYPLLDFQVPRWIEAIETARKLALHNKNIYFPDF